MIIAMLFLLLMIVFLIGTFCKDSQQQEQV